MAMNYPNIEKNLTHMGDAHVRCLVQSHVWTVLWDPPEPRQSWKRCPPRSLALKFNGFRKHNTSHPILVLMTFGVGLVGWMDHRRAQVDRTKGVCNFSARHPHVSNFLHCWGFLFACNWIQRNLCSNGLQPKVIDFYFLPKNDKTIDHWRGEGRKKKSREVDGTLTSPRFSLIWIFTVVTGYSFHISPSNSYYF